MKRLPIIVIIAAGMALSGCGAPGSSTTDGSAISVDGFTLGAMAACSPPVDVDAATLERSCAGNLERATAALDAREPGHAAVISYTMYTDGTQPGPIDVTGNAAPPTPAPATRGLSVTVFVFTLADGSTRATGVACGEQAPCVGIASYPH